MPKKIPIINCHTHIFTGNHVPSYLAKTFVPWPIYYLLPVYLIVKGFRWYYKTVDTWRFKPMFKKVQAVLYEIDIFTKRTVIGGLLSFIIGSFLLIQVFFIIYDWIAATGLPQTSVGERIKDIRTFLGEYYLIQIPESFVLKALLVLVFLLFFKTGRNLLFFVLKKIWTFLGVLPGKKTKELIKRYINIGRYAFHTKQQSSLEDLRDQYPNGTRFVVLPMDMEYMGAGPLKGKRSYISQMEELRDLKVDEKFSELIFPFVFADPRRIKGNPQYFDYKIEESKIVLKDCFVKTYIENHAFSGFKIYPALGYYPFDMHLLPLWKYAADNDLPILTHCIRGTIFYRGSKKKEWDRHPVFEQNCGKNEYEPLLLKETKNVDFSNNFTHPLNYLCLLEERLLRKLVHQYNDNNIKALFGYVDENTPMKYDLKNLKICFGHFGGDDEWNKFLEMDRYDHTKKIITAPDLGIQFFPAVGQKETPGKLEQLWKYVDWYSIICSIMLQYDNVYADLSYIIHNNGIQPLLKHTLLNEKLNKKVLFGTDFYVVRNHKSEKNMLVDSIDNLSEEEFEQIANINPKCFLNNNIHGPLSH